jgi:hypothetical protein
MKSANGSLLEMVQKFVYGQHQNVSGHHQTHLAQAIGQYGKKDADTTFYVPSPIKVFFFGKISPKSDPKNMAATSPKEFFYKKTKIFTKLRFFEKSHR